MSEARTPLEYELIKASDPLRDSENSGMLHISTVLRIVREHNPEMIIAAFLNTLDKAALAHVIRNVPLGNEGDGLLNSERATNAVIKEIHNQLTRTKE